MKTINRLHKQRCYLAGAIDRVADRGAGWRQEITPFLQNLNIEVFNPLTKPSDIGIEDKNVSEYKILLKQNQKYDELSELMKQIRSVDLRLVDISDFLIVNLDIETHPCGTLEEIFWANRQKKPIIVRMVQGKQNAPDWLFGTIPHNNIFDNWDQIQFYLTHINNNGDQKINSRWRFFNYGR